MKHIFAILILLTATTSAFAEAQLSTIAKAAMGTDDKVVTAANCETFVILFKLAVKKEFEKPVIIGGDSQGTYSPEEQADMIQQAADNVSEACKESQAEGRTHAQFVEDTVRAN